MLAACGQAVQEDRALLTAEAYYDSLIAGNHACFIRGTYMADTVPPSYREQLVTNLRMFLARQEDEHKGIKAVEPLSCRHDTLLSADRKLSVHVAEAFLMLTYGDSLKEEIVVPMIEHDHVWLMR